mmetsp:Transcript_17155/g.19339  ORF Transcript_17155/g.19339 Transcript_17155/m.19339 type:complete len:156 (+) Transcript_17155:1110-1577(+)
MKVTDFSFPTKCLDAFDLKFEKFNEISPDPLLWSMAVSFLKIATHGNSEFLSAWASCGTICENISTGSTLTYDQYFVYLVSHVKKLVDAINNNLMSLKANIAESDNMQPYSPSDECYNEAADLSNYMAYQGNDVDMIQDVLLCNTAMKQEKPFPP